jgi:hypothetical protein
MDGLCRTEYQIGMPSFPLAQQLRTCSAALSEPDSQSGPTFREVARKERAAVTETIDAALAEDDIAAFDDAVLHYRSLPGSYPEAVGHWTHQAWTVVDRQAQAAPNKTALAMTISRLSNHFPDLRNMSERQFRHWVQDNMMVGGISIVSNVEIRKRAVALWVGDDQQKNAALSLDRFARVNDGLVARCRCNGRTNVALDDGGLPLYVVRLDTAIRQSEVLILYGP